MNNGENRQQSYVQNRLQSQVQNRQQSQVQNGVHSACPANERLLRSQADSIRSRRRVKSPQGGQMTVEAALNEIEELDTKIGKEIRAGHLEHHRMPKFLRNVPVIVALCDAAILLWFMAGVLNVNWAAPFTLNTLLAITLALFGTGISYAVCTLAGTRLRGYKDIHNKFHWRELDGTTYACVAGAVVAAISIAVMMYIRVREEIMNALGPAASSMAIVFAVVFAILTVLSNLAIVAIHALDGSNLTARVERLDKATRKPEKKRDRLLRRADKIHYAPRPGG